MFITVSVLLALGTGVWGIQSHLEQANEAHLALGLGAFIIAAALVTYGVWFLRKIKSPDFK